MELRHLRYFVALTEDLHFGKAAARLNMSQPPLSQQIMQLEQDLGVQLFHRTNRRVTLTEPGKLFLVEARKVLHLAEHARDVAARAESGELGELVVGIFPSALLVERISVFVRRFRGLYPSVRLTLREFSSRAVVEELQSGGLEVAFVRHPERLSLPAGYADRMIADDPLVIAMHKDHPLAVESEGVPLSRLVGEPMVYFSIKRALPLHHQVVALCQAEGFEPRIEHEATENGALLALIASGAGISILPQSLCRLSLPELCTRPLLNSSASTKIWLVYPHDAKSPLVNSLLRAIDEAGPMSNALQGFANDVSCPS